MKFTEYMWGWDATLPEMVTDNNWDMVYKVYVKDKYDLGLEEFFKENPYQYQSMTARMLETIRKEYWDASNEVIQSLVSEYVESVVENGVTCCHHTCGNPLLDEYIQGVLSVPGLVSEDVAEMYRQLMNDATGRQAPPVDVTSVKTQDSDSSAWRRLQDSQSANESVNADSGFGTNVEQAPESSLKSISDSDYVEGYEMQDETQQTPETGMMSFSGSDIAAFLVTILVAGAIYTGFRRGGV